MNEIDYIIKNTETIEDVKMLKETISHKIKTTDEEIPRLLIVMPTLDIESAKTLFYNDGTPKASFQISNSLKHKIENAIDNNFSRNMEDVTIKVDPYFFSDEELDSLAKNMRVEKDINGMDILFSLYEYKPELTGLSGDYTRTHSSDIIRKYKSDLKNKLPMCKERLERYAYLLRRLNDKEMEFNNQMSVNRQR